MIQTELKDLRLLVLQSSLLSMCEKSLQWSLIVLNTRVLTLQRPVIEIEDPFRISVLLMFYHKEFMGMIDHRL